MKSFIFWQQTPYFSIFFDAIDFRLYKFNKVISAQKIFELS